MTLLKFIPLFFSLTLPLAAQTELPITTPTRDPAVGNQAAPRAASLGDRALIVWGEGPAALGGPSITTSVRAARIDGDGKLLDQNALIIESPAAEGLPQYDVVASGDRFVVAYGDFGLRVRSVGRDGTLGGPVTLDAYSGSSLRIAASNDGSRFLIVWSRPHPMAALLDGDLHVLATNIDLGTLPAASSAFALVARGDGFALIARSDDARIVAWTLDANAHVTGEQTLATDIPAYLSIDANANGDQISIITGSLEIEWTPSEVIINRGFPGLTATLEVRPPHSVLDAVSVRVTNGTYTALTTDDGLGQTDLFGVLNSGPIDIVAGSPSFQTAQAIASNAAGESLVVWREYSTRSRVWQLLARIVDRAGVPVGAVTTIWGTVPNSGDDFAYGMPRVTSDGTRFLVTYGLNTIRGQFVSNDGTLIGDPFVITETAFTWLNYAGWHDATWNGQRYLVTWVEGSGGRFVVDQHAVGAFVGNDGTVGSSFRITSDQAPTYSQAFSPAGDTLLTSWNANGFESTIVHSDGAVGGPYFAIAPGASLPVTAWSGSAFVAAWSANGRLQTGVIHPDGSTTVLPPRDIAMSPTDASGTLIAGVTADGVAVQQLDTSAQPIGEPVIVAAGAASPVISGSGLLAYTRADDRNITRIFVQRPASIIRHRPAAH